MDILQIVSSNVPTSQSVAYSCVLTNKWSMATHPVDYADISDSAHWSSPVLVAHSSSYELWSPGKLASLGVENVAEVCTVHFYSAAGYIYFHFNLLTEFLCI